MMKFRWLLLLPSVLSVFLLSSPANAGKLLNWRFNAQQNQLTFSTDEGVQPTAQLIADPTRLVIDLPGATFGRPTVNQPVANVGAIRQIRVGQFENRTTRIVVELAPGYTLDPQQVKFRGASPTQWSVQLPTPQRITQSSRPAPTTPPRRSTGSGAAVLQNFQTTRDGFFLRTSGGEPKNIKVKRSRDRRTIDIDLEGTTFSSSLSRQAISANQFGVNQVRFSQVQPAVARITLSVAATSPDWNVSYNDIGLGGLVLLPEGTTATNVGNFPDSPVSQAPSPISIPVPAPERATTPPPPTRTPNSRIVVMIDPGHGGKDPGAVGIGGLQEKNVIFPISKQIAAILERQGITAVITRNDDRFITLQQRVQMAQQARATVFVSIHANAISMSRPDVNGLETYYYSSGAGLARSIHNSMLQSVNMRDRGVRQARFYVLRNTSMPSVLVEVGFVTGREDAPKLASPAFQTQMAEAIARGIIQYVK
jgi:N-acetylmuramoyl-L-alanine amidase